MSTKRNTIFLDIDGVLVTWATVRSYCFLDPVEGSTSIQGKHYHEFDKPCVDALNNLIERTNATVVISSTWRLMYKKSELLQIFEKEGIHLNQTELYTTKDFPGSGNTRGREIRAFLINHDWVSNFVIIDDDEVPGLEEYRIKTSMATGFRREQVDKAIQIIKTKDATVFTEPPIGKIHGKTNY